MKHHHHPYPLIFAFPLTFVHKSLPESNRREQKIKLSAVQSPRPYILLHCLTNSKINFSQHSHCERVVKTKESVLHNVTRSSQSRFFPKVHRHCELPLQHYKQREKKKQRITFFPLRYMPASSPIGLFRGLLLHKRASIQENLQISSCPACVAYSKNEEAHHVDLLLLLFNFCGNVVSGCKQPRLSVANDYR